MEYIVRFAAAIATAKPAVIAKASGSGYVPSAKKFKA